MTIKVLQANLNRSSLATENTLHLALELGVEILAVQEPWLANFGNDHEYITRRSITHHSFTQVFPSITNKELRPRTMIYILKNTLLQTSLWDQSPQDPDMMAIRIHGNGSDFILFNIYNQKCQTGRSLTTIERCMPLLKPNASSIVVGDFNEHHPNWDPLNPISRGANTLHEWFVGNNLSIMNKIGEGTFHRPNMKNFSTIDLTLAGKKMADKIANWQVIHTGSDHMGILFDVHEPSRELARFQPHQTRYNVNKANWNLFEKTLKKLLGRAPTVNDQVLHSLATYTAKQVLQRPDIQAKLDRVAIELTTILTTAADKAIPRKTTLKTQKAWWNKSLTDQRKLFLKAQRRVKSKPEDAEAAADYRKLRNKYFQAIKVCKKNHWNAFLEKESPDTIFKAMKYTKAVQVNQIPNIRSETGQTCVSFYSKCQALRESLFPSPPHIKPFEWADHKERTWTWPELSIGEIEEVFNSVIRGKTPGPDGLDQFILQQAFNRNKIIFTQIYALYLKLGYHPICWRQATGVVLAKPGKPSYSEPKAYRIISLLNCLGKTLERIIAKRLGILAETTDLLHKSQIGGRLKKSAIDACMLLTNTIQTEKLDGRKTSTLLLDVKGAFDHVAKDQLLREMSRLGLPLSLLSWVDSFLRNRTLGLAFDGRTENFNNIETGVPQGSPISPILFLIYIRNLFPSTSVRYLSYIDDISMTASSNSFKNNIKILTREANHLYKRAESYAVKFDLAKSELIHFGRSKSSKHMSLQLPDGTNIHPKSTVRWLGVWFDQNLTFKDHVNIRIAQAKAAFGRMSRLANTEKGLTPYAMRQLYIACIRSISDYASPVWWRQQQHITQKLQGLQNMALRKILGCFKTSPIKPMEIEACLYPPAVRLNHAHRRYAFRIIHMTSSHPIQKELIQKLENQLEESNFSDDNENKITTRHTQEQLLLVWQSLSTIIEDKRIEEIKPFNQNFEPKSFVTNISRLDKKTEALRHNQLIRDLNGSNKLIYYTDASETQGGLGIGVSFKATHLKTGESIFRSKNIGLNQIVFNGELEGICMALEHAASLTEYIEEVGVFTDSKAAIQSLGNNSCSAGLEWKTRATVAAAKLNNFGTKVFIQWVPGHSNVPGNEDVDILAKEATQLQPDESKISIAYVQSIIRQKADLEWLDHLNKKNIIEEDLTKTYYERHYGWHLRKHMLVPKGTKRKIASSFYQLKTNHGYFKSYLYRFEHTANNLCSCGAKQTPLHLLLNCKNYEKERAKLRNDLRNKNLTLQTLLSTTINAKHTIKFLEDTKIATRLWLHDQDPG